MRRRPTTRGSGKSTRPQTAVPYRRGHLTEAVAGRDPLALFERWFAAAKGSELLEPTAAALATATRGGAPSVRMVLLKGGDHRGFVFFSSYESRKGRELAANPRAALALWWDRLGRQVRIEGRVERLSAAESDAYFAARPRASQLSTWASRQSSVLPSRQVLEARRRAAQARFRGGAVPRPKHWGGYRVVPHAVEFWQGRPHRLHDRLRYVRGARGRWRRERLSP